MDEEEAKTTDSNQQIVYVRENPLLKFFVGTTVAIVSVIAFLFVVGLLMSTIGFRPPTFDKDIVQDQFDRKVKGKAQSFADCKDKGGAIGESFPPICVYEGETFAQALTDACNDIAATAADLPRECQPKGSDAYETGAATGEKLKSSTDSFMEGLKEGYAEGSK